MYGLSRLTGYYTVLVCECVRYIPYCIVGIVCTFVLSYHVLVTTYRVLYAKLTFYPTAALWTEHSTDHRVTTYLLPGSHSRDYERSCRPLCAPHTPYKRQSPVTRISSFLHRRVNGARRHHRVNGGRRLLARPFQSHIDPCHRMQAQPAQTQWTLWSDASPAHARAGGCTESALSHTCSLLQTATLWNTCTIQPS